MSDTKKLLELAADGTKIDVVDAYRENLPELHFDDEEAEPETPTRPEPEEDYVPVAVTTSEIASFLKASYLAHGILTREMEIWTADESFFREVADGITDTINGWCMNFPALAHAIHAVDAAGSWGRLIWDYAIRWYSTLMAKKQKREEAAKKAEEEGAPFGYVAR